MKSGTASLVLAYAALYAHRHYLSGSVALCVVSDEETGGKYGTKHLVQTDKKRWGGDVMLSAEPSGMSVRFSEKGTLRMRGVVACKGAHGAYLNLRCDTIPNPNTCMIGRVHWTDLVQSGSYTYSYCLFK